MKDILYDSECLEAFENKIMENEIIESNVLLDFFEMNDSNYEDLVKFLLLVKYDKYTYFYLKEDLILNKYSDFLIYSTNIKKIVLKAERYNYKTRDFKTIFSCLSNILSKNKRINALQCESKFLENFRDYRAKNLLEFISKYPSINKIIICSNKCESNNVNFKILMENIKYNKNITDFQLIYCSLEHDINFDKLEGLLRSYRTIQNLDLNNLRINKSFLKTGHIYWLTEIFEGNSTIKSLIIGSEGLKNYIDLDDFFNMISKLENLE